MAHSSSHSQKQEISESYLLSIMTAVFKDSLLDKPKFSLCAHVEISYEADREMFLKINAMLESVAIEFSILQFYEDFEKEVQKEGSIGWFRTENQISGCPITDFFDLKQAIQKAGVQDYIIIEFQPHFDEDFPIDCVLMTEYEEIDADPCFWLKPDFIEYKYNYKNQKDAAL